MTKLIIDNKTKISDLDTLELVSSVIKHHQTSKTLKNYEYCLTIWISSPNGEVLKKQNIMVSYLKNKDSEKFVIQNEERV